MSCYRNQQLLPHSLLVSLSLLSLLAAICLGHSEVECLLHQRSLLLTLKLGFSFKYSDADHRLLSWTPGSNCCDWEGISCDPESGLVIGLDLSEYDLTGNLSSSLFSLTSLQTLNLSGNLFDTNFPQWGFENLTELMHLDLSSCGFISDQIPIGISRLTRLISLNLSNNNIQLGNTANFQTLVRNLTHLQELHLVEHDYVPFSSGIDWSKMLSISLPQLHVLSLSSGTLPRDFFQLRNWTALELDGIDLYLLRGFPENSHLELLTLFSYNMTRSLLDSIGNLKYLRELHIWGALPTRVMSSSIWNLNRLVVLRLSDNNLITIPSSIGNLTQLELLDLSNNNLNGTVPSSICNLARLVHLDLSFNNFIGTVPTTIGNLTQLEHLYLSYNNLNGTVPSFIWNLNRLVVLVLSNNNFITIPSTIGNLTQLEYLYLSYNNLNGPIPYFLFSLPAIRTLNLHHNQLSGQLNDSLGISPSLENIQLAGNQLQGQISLSIFKHSTLVSLDLSSNNFSGTVELDMFEGLKNLTRLDLSNNMLSVHDVSDYYFHSFPNLQELSLAACNLTKIPAFLRYQDNLRYLDLSNNRILGDMPKWIWTLTNSSWDYLNLSCNSFTNIEGLAGLTLDTSIEVLDLHSNMLRGPIPLPISSITVLDYSNNFFSSIIPSNISSYVKHVQFLSFANNSLTGEIPPSICKVIIFGVLDLSDNNLSGFIPPCLFKGDTRIFGLNLKGNQLQGIIPQNITNNYIEILSLHGNQLEGSLPRALANCSGLTVLDVGNNNLVDSFPFWLGNITTLRVLILRGNGFSGPVEIPNSHEANYTFGSLQIFDLSSNHFEGNLPSKCFNNMKVMMNSSQSDSHIVGAFQYIQYIVDIFYQSPIFVTNKGKDITLKKLLTIYTYIDLSNNRFEGNIPDVIGDLQGLHVLNLSRNALTGQIPSSIGNMKQLESLDLSVNHLSGRIPQELASLTFLEALNVSNNNLVGRIPQSTQISTFSNASFGGNPGLCGKPLSKLCDNATQNRTNEVAQSKDASSFSSYVIGLGLFVGLGFGVGFALVLVLQNIPLRFWKKHDNN